jgi:hypothetical protein
MRRESCVTPGSGTPFALRLSSSRAAMADDHPKRVVPCSILDTDLYKVSIRASITARHPHRLCQLSMQQAILHHFSDVQSAYRFTHRSKDVYFSRKCIDLFKESIPRTLHLLLRNVLKKSLQTSPPSRLHPRNEDTSRSTVLTSSHRISTGSESIASSQSRSRSLSSRYPLPVPTMVMSRSLRPAPGPRPSSGKYHSWPVFRRRTFSPTTRT